MATLGTAGDLAWWLLRDGVVVPRSEHIAAIEREVRWSRRESARAEQLRLQGEMCRQLLAAIAQLPDLPGPAREAVQQRLERLEALLDAPQRRVDDPPTECRSGDLRSQLGV
ncbi:MAG TPA: hypothetical protein VFD49_09095 [Candidatus Dormibacteraeota bacterium]|nr:hypothetical protein [Candidatus Dormibacteraeota bacterium]